MELTTVHRILQSNQSNSLREYVEFSTKKRQESTDEFNETIFKLRINCVYGKSMKNIRKRINVTLVNNPKK